MRLLPKKPSIHIQLLSFYNLQQNLFLTLFPSTGLQQTMAGAEREVLPKIPRPPRHQLQAERPEGSPLQESVQRGKKNIFNFKI